MATTAKQKNINNYDMIYQLELRNLFKIFIIFGIQNKNIKMKLEYRIKRH